MDDAFTQAREHNDNLDGAENHQIPASFGRRLPRPVQLLLLAFGALVVGAVLVFVLPHGSDEPMEETAPTTADGAVKLTDQQWTGMRIAAVKLLPFSASQQTDGNIAIDDDAVTPVFSPYSGRVTRLFAKVGDVVKAGDPMLAVKAAELAQGQSDLISAEATLKTAQAQFALAQTNEKRQHALYSAQGAALKDWQQSQVDLAIAEGGQRSAEIAMTAVRNRLRILGKSDAEIGAIKEGNIQNWGPMLS